MTFPVLGNVQYWANFLYNLHKETLPYTVQFPSVVVTCLYTFSVKDSSENALFLQMVMLKGLQRCILHNVRYLNFLVHVGLKCILKDFNLLLRGLLKLLFHALVHLPLWDWSSTSCMHI